MSIDVYILTQKEIPWLREKDVIACVVREEKQRGVTDTGLFIEQQDCRFIR